ncbi:MAG: pitrilysin family protein [Candidatus Omnitrophota bacterium]
MIRRETLPNGLEIATYTMSGMESVSLGVWVRAGCRYEKKEVNGISHLLEHLLFKGTERRDTETLKQEIEGRGGTFNGFTAEEHTCYLVKILAKDLTIGVDILSDMVLHPLLKEQDILKEKRVVVEEISMYKDLPNHYIHELLSETLWPGQPLGAPLAGSVESVLSIGKKELIGYKNGYYTLDNMLVFGAGNLRHDDLVRLSKRFFRSGRTSGKEPAYDRAVNAQTKPRMKVFCKDTEQTHIAVGFHSFDRFHRDRYALSLLNIILGANMSSRLFCEVRERLALCYEIATSLRRYDDAGAFVINAGVDFGRITKALAVIQKELKKIKRKLVGSEELTRAKEYYKGQLLFHLEDTMASMLWMGEKAVSKECEYNAKKMIGKVNAITPDQIRGAARSIFKNESLNLAVIGPVKKPGAIERALSV